MVRVRQKTFSHDTIGREVRLITFLIAEDKKFGRRGLQPG